MNQFIIQGIGYLALAFVIFSFQQKKRPTILIATLVGVSLFVVHYSLLHAWTGAFLNLLEASVVFVAYKKETTKWATKQFWPYLFICLYVVAGVVTAHSLSSYLPVVAQIFGTIAVWQKNPRRIRFIMLIPRPLWFIYNFLVGSQAGMVAEIFILLSVMIGIFRLDVRKPRAARG